MKRLSTLALLASVSASAGYLNLPLSGGGSGTVTGVTATAPIQSSGGTAPVISCITATGSVAGCLSAADWTTFNGKQASGNYITALTSDVSAAGPGSAAATVNSVGGSTAANVHAAELLANAATDANTSGAIVKRNSGNFSAGTITAALTGAASSNVLKAGDTMTGDLILTTAANGVTIGAAATKSKALYIKPGASGTGIQLENVNNTRKFNVDVSVAGLTIFGQDATNGFLSISNVATGGTGVNWFSMGADGGSSPPPYPQHFQCISGDGNVTALSSIKSLDGNNINGAPWVVLSNLNSTVNTIAEWVTTGSSKNPMAAFGSRHITQTAAAEDADAMISNQNAGTLTEHLRIKPKGQFVSLGTSPAAGTCGTSPGTPTGNDNFFKITSGTGGVSGTCAVTLATAPLTAGHCACRDKTTVSTVVDADVSGSTVTMTTYSRTTGVAANFAASDVFECQCSFF